MSDNKSLVTRIASRFGVDTRKFYETLKATAFKQRDGSAPTDEQMMTLLIVAEQYGLNPFTREIYAFPDKQNGIIPVVGVDGWSRIINEHPQYDGVEFVYSDKMVRMQGAKVDCPEWIECVIYRKDRSRPIRIKEFIDEVYREPFQGQGRNGAYTVDGPWQTHTKRQLRHKSLIQCSRVAFGFSGIYDQDEAERIREMEQASAINPAIANLPSPSQVQSQEPLAIEHKELDPILTKLANRAIAENAWSEVVY
ncbi:phage recombination protein Bet (plasmid) [Salmonella enterica subsp. enterica]|uniref:phage recombination protein Bet n=1 Tax=Salmonella enterica TaxID=28901 RepID=UPI003133214D